MFVSWFFLRLEVNILSRFEKENGGELLIATLCLLECSSKGLLETELRELLGDETHLTPKPEDLANEKNEKGKPQIFEPKRVQNINKKSHHIPIVRPYSDKIAFNRLISQCC